MMRPLGATSFRDIRTLFHDGTLGGLTDEQLLTRFESRPDVGAEGAFAALVERHGPMVLRVCQGVLRDDHEAMDAFQTTFLVLVRKASTLRVHDSLGPWLHRVACRAAVRAKVQSARRRALLRRTAEANAGHSHGEDRNQHVAALHEELNRLPDRYRVPIVLCDLEGRNCEEVAEQLGRPVGTVKSWLARGRRLLRDRLTRRGFTGILSIFSPRRISTLPALPRSAINAAVHIAARSGTPEAVPATVLELTEGVLRSMLHTKLKLMAAAIIATGLIAVSAVVAYQPPSLETDPADSQGPARTAGPEHGAITPASTISRPYYIGDLLLPEPPAPSDAAKKTGIDKPLVDMAPIIELITSSVAPGTWDVWDSSRKRGPRVAANKSAVGSITPFYLSPSLIVRHTAEVHDQVANRLRLLRRIRYLDRPEDLKAPISTRATTEADRRFPAPSIPRSAPAASGAGEERPQAVQERSERVRRLVKELGQEIESFTREIDRAPPGSK